MASTFANMCRAAALTALFVANPFGQAQAQRRTIAPIPEPAQYSWTGLYFGAHLGGAWSRSHWLTNHVSGVGTCPAPGFSTPCDPVSATASGLFGGGQLGARWQTNGWVFGLEASLALTRLREETQSINVPSGTLTYDTRLRNLTSGTASLGYAFDRTLIYVKGGYVVSRLERDSRAALFPGGAAALASTSERAHGWTLGIGAEYALTNALSLGLEYNVMSLRAHDAATCTTGIGTTFSCGAASAPLNMTGFRSDTQSVGLRLDYKLDGR